MSKHIYNKYIFMVDCTASAHEPTGLCPVRQDTAKVFMSGPSQAVRLPKKFRFPEGCSEVSVRRLGRHLVLSPRFDDWEAYWVGSTRPYGSLGPDVLEFHARGGTTEPPEETG